MGMNTITIDILPKEIQYLFINGTWKFEGISNISYEMVLKFIKKLKLKKLGTNYYTNHKSIDIRILERNNMLIAIRVEGLVQCFDNVVEDCYKMAKSLSKLFEPKFCVLGVNIKYGSCDQYSVNVKQLYQEKINWYKNGYLKEFISVIPPHKFDRVYKRFLRKRKIAGFLKSLVN